VAYTVNAGGVVLAWLFVTLGAIDRFGCDIVVGVFRGEVCVTTGASVGSVNGCLEPGFIHEQGNPFAGGVGFVKGLVGVALQAGAVGVLVGGGGKGEEA
jgi:hypothetical protein